MTIHDAEMSIPICDVPYAVYARRDVDPDLICWVSFSDGEADRGPMRWFREKSPQGVSPIATSTAAAAVRAAIKPGVCKGLLPVCLAEEDDTLVCISDNSSYFIRILHAQVHLDMVQSAKLRPVLRLLRETHGGGA